ncbi:MAG TPA: hypothetical protein VF296_06725 [Gallionella sp.]|jgi:hypothetical protein
MENAENSGFVIPAKAGIQFLNKLPRNAGTKPNGIFKKPLDGRSSKLRPMASFSGRSLPRNAVIRGRNDELIEIF